MQMGDCIMMKQYIEDAEKVLLHTYNRYQIVFEKGEGCYLEDVEGKKYLDFAAGIAVFAFGYGNKEYNDYLKGQIDKLLHTSNLFYSVPTIEAAKKLTQVSGMDRVFFTNSGAEAIEGAIKTARKYAFTKDGSTDHEIIAMKQSFHGRTMGALSVTGNYHYQEAFKPMIGNVAFAEYNNLESVKALVNEKTCAIILETVQGEGGIHPAEKEFLEGIKTICTENDILLILDEIQCGMGRCGSMFAWQGYGVKPDVLVTAKALGCGVPVGAFLMTEEVAEKSLKPGDHGTTYGGNPFVCAAVCKVLSMFEEERLVEHVNQIAPYLEKSLDEFAQKYDCIKERRGKGLMQALEFSKPVGEIVVAAQKEGLIVITAGANTIRLVPPLIISEEHVDEMIRKLEKAMSK